jgi:outer membrane biosynthesis protein TonB
VSGFKEFVQARKGTVLSALLHVVVIGWSLISLATRPLEALPQDIVPVDVISDEKLSQMMKGLKDGDKKQQAPLVEKVAEPKPADQAVGKVNDKKDVIQPDKQEVPKPVVQDKPKDEPKPAKEEPKVDQIAEKLKQQNQQKEPPKPEAKQTPQPPPKKQYAFNAANTKALLDKRDPARQSITGEQLNPKSALGVAAPAAMTQKNTFGWIAALQRRIGSCWAVPAGVRDADTMQVRILIKLGPDGMLQGRPELAEAPPNSIGPAFAESAIRAIEQCQPYNFLPQAEYKNGWDYMDMIFTPQDLFRR